MSFKHGHQGICAGERKGEKIKQQRNIRKFSLTDGGKKGFCSLNSFGQMDLQFRKYKKHEKHCISA